MIAAPGAGGNHERARVTCPRLRGHGGSRHDRAHAGKPPSRRTITLGGITGTLLTLAAGIASGADDGRLGPADLADYRAALAAPPSGPAQPVGFRDLWDRPEAYRGRLVRVQGQVARRFRQGPVGAFPPLAELWVVSPQGDPLCLVYPARGDGAEPGAQVRFEGTFLRRVRYRSSDGDRLAPLVVGSGRPLVVKAAPVPATTPSFEVPVDWLVGLAVAGFVVLILGAQHLRRRPRAVRRGEPPPVFLEAGDPDPDDRPGDDPGSRTDGP